MNLLLKNCILVSEKLIVRIDNTINEKIVSWRGINYYLTFLLYWTISNIEIIILTLKVQKKKSYCSCDKIIFIFEDNKIFGKTLG